jgi:CRP-like cAMP-binding protein
MILYFAHCAGNILVGNSETFSRILFEECISLNNIEAMKKCRGDIVKTRFFDVYSYSVYTGYFIITGNELKLFDSWEKFAFVGISVISMGLTASIFGNVAILISNMSFGVSPVVQEKIDIMKEYMGYMKYDKSFIETIETYHVNIWSKQRTMLYTDDFFGDLSQGLMKMILIDQWKTTFFYNGTWLKLCSNDFFNSIIAILKPKIFMKQDVIVSEGDFTQDCYFISNNGSASVKISGQWLKNMGSGEIFGEISMFLRSKRRTATVTSLNDSDYLVVQSEYYENALRDFPETCYNIKEIAINRLMSSIKLYPSFVFAKLVPKNDLKDYLIRKCIYLDNYEEDELFANKKVDNTESYVNIDKYEKEFNQVKILLLTAQESIKEAAEIMEEKKEEYEAKLLKKNFKSNDEDED